MKIKKLTFNQYKYFLLLTFSLLLCCESAQMQESEAGKDDKAQRVDKFFEHFNDGKSPGAAVAVVKDGEIIYSQGYGMANLEYDIPNSPSTIFHIASISKQFTCFAALLLQEEGKLSMDDDIRKYIPEVPDFGKTITLRHLANHTSGLRDQWNLLALAGWRLDDVITKEHIMKLVEKQEDLNFEPGEAYYYCNTGYTLLAEAVSRVSGMSFAEFTEERIFAPLGMESTLFYDDHQMIVPNRAYSYGRNGQGYTKSVLSYANVGATSLFTTVEDLARWAVNFENGKVGSEKSLEEMHRRGILNNGDTITYALGQGIGKYRGLNTVSHGGADAGYRTNILRFPDQKFSVIIFSNFGNFNPTWISNMVANVYLEEEFTETFKNTRSTRPEKEEKPMPGSLSDYAGSYYSPELSTTYEMKIVDGKLVAEHSRHSDIGLEHETADNFKADAWFKRNITFTRNSQGKVTGYLVNSGRVQKLKFEKVK